MAWIALTCPQCGAPLPRLALWRSVKCGSCGSLITKTESIVARDSFHQALLRARQEPVSQETLVCGGSRYALMQTLGVSQTSKVYLGRRVGSPPLLATIKLSSSPTAASRYAREAEVLRALQNLDADGVGAYLSRLLPEAIAHGAVEGNDRTHALVLTHPTGFWGNLAALGDRFPAGLDPRHTVWIWRRMLEVLAFIHRHGWSHGDVRPEHALVHPQNHGIRLIGWASATKGAGQKAEAADLCRSARVVRVLLSGTDGSDIAPAGVPTSLFELINKASLDERFCLEQRADGLDALLQSAAKTAFGPPSFVPLII
jgi:serine/threonine protein kinase